MSPEEINTLVQIIAVSLAGLSTLVGLIILMHKKVMVPIMKMVHGYYKLCEKVDYIFKEVRSNDGKSLKDKVNEISVSVKKLDARQKAVLAGTTEGHFETDSTGNIIWVNRTFAKELGCVPFELIGHGWENFVSSSERECKMSLWYKSIEEQTEVTMKLNFVSYNDVDIPALLRTYKLVDLKGELFGFFATVKFLDHYSE